MLSALGQQFLFLISLYSVFMDNSFYLVVSGMKVKDMNIKFIDIAKPNILSKIHKAV